MIGGLGTPEILIIGLVIVLLFGVGRIGKIAGELGGGIRAFKEGLKGDEEKSKEDKEEKETSKE
ncbi:MAG: twin-arginine translocase TatA/TatE family subunit [Chloroflexota bacterium]